MKTVIAGSILLVRRLTAAATLMMLSVREFKVNGHLFMNPKIKRTIRDCTLSISTMAGWSGIQG